MIVSQQKFATGYHGHPVGLFIDKELRESHLPLLAESTPRARISRNFFLPYTSTLFSTGVNREVIYWVKGFVHVLF